MSRNEVDVLKYSLPTLPVHATLLKLGRIEFVACDRSNVDLCQICSAAKLPGMDLDS